jgi:predicted nucleotidyltransferase component of viral defense system
LSDILTPGQRAFLDSFSETDLAQAFYLTGGTALSAFYLHHRVSLDLDLFARHPFDPKHVVRFLGSVAEAPIIPRREHDRYEFTVPLQGERLRVEFVHYDFDAVASSGVAYRRVRVDSLRDILANKLSSVIERTEAKDYADLLFLLRRPDLGLAPGMEDCRRKFGWPGLEYLLQTAFLRVDELAAWPATQPATTIDEARGFFRDLTRSLIRLED